MLFNSYEFIFLFLPVTLSGYFVLNRKKLATAAAVWLTVASLFFYAYWDLRYLPLLLGSICFNYAAGSILGRGRLSSGNKKILLASGISCNILLLGYYKYLNFFISNVNHFLAFRFGPLDLLLPLGISFFTFTQIAFLVDNYKGKAREYNFLNYILFVAFFPHLIAGPIIHHAEMMPQFYSLKNKILNWKNIMVGLSLFSMGLFKKVAIADTLSAAAAKGFDVADTLNFFSAWVTSLSFTMQLYFDFSGYTDMALGLALMFNIALPRNFNSPYKALNIQDFWRRWHMTLSRFLKEYVYLPLGGNRRGELLAYINILIVFFIGGIWHGAGWTFIFWGCLNGAAMVIYKIWVKSGLKMNRVLAWIITFNFTNICWVFFRARSFDDAAKVLTGMAGLSGVVLPSFLGEKLSVLKNYGVEFGGMLRDINSEGFGIGYIVYLLAFSIMAALILINSDETAKRFGPNGVTAFITSVVFFFALSNITKASEFLYFNF